MTAKRQGSTEPGNWLVPRLERLVLATGNPGKLAEFRSLLAPLDIDVVAQGDMAVKEADEPYDTFLENALVKARNAARSTGLAALADDSGLCVDALYGAPGVHSARFGGEPRSDAKNNAALIEALQGQTLRSAHYTCVLVLVRSANDPEPLVTMGHMQGVIVDTPQGTNGFGYDPYFYLPTYRQTAAQLSPVQKNRVSHRAQAMQQLVTLLHQAT